MRNPFRRPRNDEEWCNFLEVIAIITLAFHLFEFAIWWLTQ